MFFADNIRKFSLVDSIPVLASIAVIVVAAWNLFCRIYALPLDVSIFSNSNQMSFLGGINFLFLGISCLLLCYLRNSRIVRIIGGVLVSLVFIGCLLVLMRYFFGIHFDFQPYLYAGLPDISKTQQINISMLSALGFVFVSLGFLLFIINKEELAQYVLIFSLILPLALLLGCFYNVSASSFTQIYGNVPCTTSMVFILLITGVLFLNPKRGLISLMISRRPGGVLMRQLIPIVIIVPILFGFIRLLGQQNGWFTAPFGTTLSVSLNMIIMLVICWVTGRRLDTVDRYREAMKQESVKQARLLQAIIDNTTAFVYVKDMSENFILVNESLVQRFQLTRNDFIGKNCYDIFGEHYASAYHINEEKVLATRQAISFEEIAPIEGKDHVFLSNKFPLFDEAGEIYALGGLSSDITYQKEIEEELRHTKIQAEQLADEALAASRAKSAFLATMSHEIRTPLNGIIGMTDLLLNYDLPSTQKDFVNTIQLSGWNLLEVINEILDFSKIEAGHLEIEKIDFDLRNLVEDIVEILATNAHKKDIALGGLIEADVPGWVTTDPTHLRHILINLLGNAVKFTNRGEICLKVSIDESVLPDKENTKINLRFDVTDTGIGMSKETIAGLFQPFTQGDSSISRKYGGTGLGLVIAKKLIDILGGEVTVESMFGIGSHFSVIIPVERAKPAAPVVEDNLSPLLEGLRVLMVDDNEVNRRIVQAQTVAWKMRCDVVENAYAALVKCRAAVQEGDPYALVFIDYAMPVMDGMDLAKKISTYPELAKTPLLMMTSLGKPVSSKELEEIGIQVCLTKPVRQSRLYEGILLALSKSSSPLLNGKMNQHSAKASHADDQAQSQSAKILLAEDYPINQQVALLLLAKLGYQADVVENGIEVLKACADKQYDVILMDCQMPEMDGYTATRKIREQEKESGEHILIVAMTAHALKGDKEKCLAAGMDDYLSKPVKIEDLKEVLARVLKLSREAIFEERPEQVKVDRDKENHIRHVIDCERLTLLFGDDKSLLSDFLALFINTTQDTLTKLAATLKKRDSEAGKKLAHALKGSSANSGADELAAIALCMEEYMLSQDWERAEIGYQELKEAFTRVRDAAVNIRL